MSTSAQSGLSAEAEEFVPCFSMPTGPSVPLFQPSRPIYPLMKATHHPPFAMDPVPSLFQPSASSTSGSQIILLPASNPSAGFYPSTVPPVYFSSNIPSSSNFYPLEPPPPPPPPSIFSLRSSGHARISTQSARPHPSSSHSTHRSQLGHQDHSAVPNDPAVAVPQSRGNRQARNQERATVRIHNDDSRFQFRKEDFPILPLQNEQLHKIVPVPVIPNNTKPMASWTTVVSTPRPQSTSPHPAAAQRTSDPQSKHSSASTRQSSPNPRSTSVTSVGSSTKGNLASTTQQNLPSPKQKSRRSKKQKHPAPAPVAVTPPPPPPSVSLLLDDENAFPTLAQQITIGSSKKAEPDHSTKTHVTTPGVIPKPHVKAQHTYQVRLTEMFNALSTATRAKPVPHQQQKTNPVTTITNANPLDSNPAPKRGKEREQPKARKPTKLKRIINKELEENQKQRQQLLSKVNSIKQAEEKDPSNETDTNTITATDDVHHDPSVQEIPSIGCEYTSASCTEESNPESEEEEEEEEDDDEGLDHQPTSQSQTPFADQLPSSNIKQQIHDGAFREYCSQLIDRQLDELCIQLLLTLKRFQDRKKQQFQSNPERARRKRRFVHGIREVTKHLRSQRLKCVFIAPDCQSIQSQGGLNDAIEQIINLCKEQAIPYIFTLNRQKLGRCLNKISRISAIGIFDCSGADQIYKQILDITNENQSAYKQIIDNILHHEEAPPIATPAHGLNTREFYKILHRTFQQQQQNQNPQPKRQHVVNNIPAESLSKKPKTPAHYAHSRQTSDTSTIYIDPQLISSINAVKKQHTRASSGTFELPKSNPSTTKNHQRTLSDGAANDIACALPGKHPLKTHSRTPSGCSAISQIELQDYFEQTKHVIANNNHEETAGESEESRLKSIHEDTEEMSANSKRKNVADWINKN